MIVCCAIFLGQLDGLFLLIPGTVGVWISARTYLFAVRHIRGRKAFEDLWENDMMNMTQREKREIHRAHINIHSNQSRQSSNVYVRSAKSISNNVMVLSSLRQFNLVLTVRA